MNYVKDFQALQKYRSDLFVGVVCIIYTLILVQLYNCLATFKIFVVQGKITFLGSRPRNRQVLQRRMYRHEIEQWMQEAAAVDKRL